MRLVAVSGTQGSDFRARKLLAITAASTRRSAEDVIQAICEFLLNGEDLTIEVTLDRSIFLMALRFEGGIQGSDSPFKGEYLNLPLGYPGSCPIHCCVRRYVGHLTEEKTSRRRRTMSGECQMSGEVWCVAGLPSAAASVPV